MKLVGKHEGDVLEVEIERHGTGYRVRINDRWIEADIVDAGPFVRSMRLADGTQLSLLQHRDGTSHEISMADATVRVEMMDPLALRRKGREDDTAAGGVIRALMPGRIVRVLIAAGDAVVKGAGLLVLEAMKMENEIQATTDGVVDQIFVEVGQTVEGGTDLLHLTPVTKVDS